MNNFLETHRISTLMCKYSIPCIISLLVGALYNIVDQIFIANASYLGSYGNAANTVIFPLTVIALAISVMIGDGTCAFVSIAIGKKDIKDAGNSIGSATLLLILTSVILTVIYLYLSDVLVTAFGGRVNAETFALSKEYFFWITIGIPFYMFGQGMNPIIRSDGSPRLAMVTTLSGAIVNIILDPIFIFAFKWGMMGAAIATVIGQMVTAIICIIYMCHMKTVKLTSSNFKFHFPLIKKYIPLGFCSFFSQISLVIAMAAINNMVRKYSALDMVFSNPEYAQIPMAVLGIVMKYFQIVISIVVGMAAGCIPIAGYNLGAGRKDRTASLFKLLLISETVVGFIALFFAEVTPSGIMKIFGSANESSYYLEFAIKAFRTYMCMIVLACINKASFIYIQALGKAILSTSLSVIREIVFGVGFALLLPHFFGLDGVLYSMPLSDIVAFVLSVGAIIYTFKELSGAR